MTAGDYLINVLSAVIAIEYMDHGFPKKFSGSLRLLWLLTGFKVYFLVVTKINMITEFENMEFSYKKNLEIRQQESLEDLYRMVRDVNRIHHDVNGKLGVLYYLLKKQKYEEVQLYVEELLGVLSRYPELPKDTGNAGLNAALIKAAQECREKGIRFHSSILGSPDKIDSMDMGVLLYNLFNNGIEACLEIQAEKERRLELVLMERKDETELQLLNSIGRSVLLENPNLESRKKDRECHGFGMDNIYRIIKKYHGEYGCREEEDCFIQMITLLHLR